MTHKYAPPVNGKLGIYYPDLDLNIEKIAAYNILKQKEYAITKINIFEIAKETVGKDYKRGSSLKQNPPKSFDCSSLIKWIYGQMGIWIPRISFDQFEYGREIEINDICPGDLIFTQGALPYSKDSIQIGHVGMLLDDNCIVHAANKESGVIVSPFENYLEKGVKVCRIHEHLNEVETIILPPESNVEYVYHLRWKIFQNI